MYILTPGYWKFGKLDFIGPLVPCALGSYSIPNSAASLGFGGVNVSLYKQSVEEI